MVKEAKAVMAQGADIEKVVVANLGELEIPYELIEIDPAYADTAAFCSSMATLWMSAGTP